LKKLLYIFCIVLSLFYFAFCFLQGKLSSFLRSSFPFFLFVFKKGENCTINTSKYVEVYYYIHIYFYVNLYPNLLVNLYPNLASEIGIRDWHPRLVSEICIRDWHPNLAALTWHPNLAPLTWNLNLAALTWQP
jgi:hypothetical protein